MPEANNITPECSSERRDWHDWISTIGIPLTLIAAASAAFFSFSQWRTAADTEKRQLRAYVGVIPSDVENFGTMHQQFTLIRKNYGLTPAYDLGTSEVGVEITAPTTPVPGSSCSPPGPHGLITLFPGSELKLTITTNINFPQAQTEVVRNDAGLVLRYYGNICYHDAWNRPHYTNYCFMYKGTSMTAKDADWCLQHNDADSD